MRIAIIGSGISGLTAAYLLHNDHQITIYEKNNYIGGHSNTVDARLQEKIFPVDTGFIVFNEKTYPNFVKLLRKLGVIWKKSDMSFSVSCQRTGLEYSPSSLGNIFAQRKNILNPSLWKMALDIFRFRKNYENVLNESEDITLMDLLEREKYSRFFRDYFIIPMGAAIWSADPKHFGQIPAKFFIRFFQNHGFLNIKNQPQWLTIEKGSRQYVEVLTAGFKNQIRLSSAVTNIRRFNDYVLIKTADKKEEKYDHVIIATHSDQAIVMLDDPSEAENNILSAIPYNKNITVLHTDVSLLPKIHKTWASWNYFIPEKEKANVILTYNMNMLQSIQASDTFCVTLNAKEQIHQKKILYEIEYAHPMFQKESVDAQKRHHEISGNNRTHYCGAYWGNGFHEDGVNSALEVCKYFDKGL